MQHSQGKVQLLSPSHSKNPKFQEKKKHFKIFKSVYGCNSFGFPLDVNLIYLPVVLGCNSFVFHLDIKSLSPSVCLSCNSFGFPSDINFFHLQVVLIVIPLGFLRHESLYPLGGPNCKWSEVSH